MINMVEKKDDSKIKKVVKKTTSQEAPKPVEQKYFAEDLANGMGISSYDFFLIKRVARIQNGTLITRSEMQKLYNKIIRR